MYVKFGHERTEMGAEWRLFDLWHSYGIKHGIFDFYARLPTFFRAKVANALSKENIARFGRKIVG